MAKKHYLNDFEMQENGKYAYAGSSYAFAGTKEELKKAYVKLLVILVLLIASFIAAGFITGGGMKNSFYVILPYIGEAAALFFSAYYTVRLFLKGDTVREYVYNQTAKRMPNAFTIVAFFAAAGLICSLAFSISGGFKEELLESILYLVFKAADIALALSFANSFRSLEWLKI